MHHWCSRCVITDGVLCDVLYDAAANSESAQPANDNSMQQNPPPAEQTNVPHIPESNVDSSRLEPEQVPPQQGVAVSKAPPTVCIALQ